MYQDPTSIEITLKSLKRLGLKLDLEKVAKAYYDSYNIWHRKMYEFLGKTSEMWIDLDSLILENLGILDPDKKIAKAIWASFDAQHTIHPYPDCLETLSKLKRNGYKLGIISNYTEGIVQSLESIGLLHLFDSVTFSQEVKAEKPSKHIFLKALQRMNVIPEKCLHIGDSYERDVIGAQEVGMIPILLNRNKKNSLFNCNTIGSLSKIFEILH
jgi:REG-2-like HAD superfamily hydrolase